MSKYQDPSLSDKSNPKQITKKECLETSQPVEKVINLQAVKKMSSKVELSKIKNSEKIILPPKKLEASKVDEKPVKPAINQGIDYFLF